MPIAQRASRVSGDGGHNAMLAVAVAADSEGRLLDFRVADWTFEEPLDGIGLLNGSNKN